MTIDAATLPIIEAGATLEPGQLFTIRGSNLDKWPDELVLGYSANPVMSSNDALYTMELVEKTADKVVFTPRVQQAYSQTHIWYIFGTPSSRPRTILEYSTE